jgi:hypothetical protein
MLHYLYRRGQLRGLFGGSKGWTLVWAVIFGARMLKKASTREPEVVYSEVLSPGETVVVRHEDRLLKKKEKKKKKAEAEQTEKKPAASGRR